MPAGRPRAWREDDRVSVRRTERASDWAVEWAQVEAREPRLHAAARHGDDRTIARLLDEGADVDELFDVQLDPGARSVLVSALGWAAGSAEGATAATVDLLLRRGASVAVEGARPPLLCALAGVDVRFRTGGDIERVRRLAQAHLDAFGALPVDPEGDWLRRTVDTGDADRVRFLLELGADPDPPLPQRWSSTPLERAIKGDAVEIVRMLLDAGADPDRRAFHLHFPLGTARSVAVLEQLLDAGASIDPPILGEPERRSSDPAEWTLSGIACASTVERSERVAMIALLQERRGLTRADLTRALRHAAYEAKDAEGVLALIEAGADLSDRPSVLAAACFGHRTDHDAGTEAVIDALIDAGLDADDRDENGFSPLLTALGPDTYGPGYQESDGANRPAALALIRRGADVDIRYPETGISSLERVVVAGFTPLHLAARIGDGELVRALLDAGADPSARTPAGDRALDLAAAALGSLTGPGAVPPEPAPAGASPWKVLATQQDHERWDRFVADAQAAVDLLTAATGTTGASA